MNRDVLTRGLPPHARRALSALVAGGFALATAVGAADRAVAQDAPPSAPAQTPQGPAVGDGAQAAGSQGGAGAAAGASDVPWAGATATGSAEGAATLPSFLETQDRRIRDNRPPPSPEQLQALRQMEAEVGSYTQSASSYRDTVTSIVRREYLRQRRSRDEGYARQIREEERLQNEARERAIRLFERFIERYPDDPVYTPDAMFRLGELYYERSALEFQAAVERANAEREAAVAAGRDGSEIADPEKDFNPTIDLYRRLVTKFPNYRRLDGVFYLIGYCLTEMNKIEEARMAFLNLVCGNRFRYDPEAMASARAAAAAAGEPASPNLRPSQTMDLPGASASQDAGPFVDPYADCQPITRELEFLGEVWLRIGEYHFDNDFGAHGLSRAISAYSKVLRMPEDRNYNLALYKMAWSYYRASRYPEALRHFTDLVQWSDDERARTGRAGSELRAEAIQYLAITFAYDDWNENQIPDPNEGQPTGFQRIQNAQFLPQDKPWTIEVYVALGNIYFDEAKYPQAIEVFEYILRRWPNSRQAPEVQNMIARSYRRANELDRELQAQANFRNFCPGTPWYAANVENPAEQRRAEQLCENALIQTAVTFHGQAQQLRARCVADRNVDLCRQAQERYRLAADAYRNYIRQYPNNAQAYELNYNLADALFWSEDYESAAREYAAVRDSNLDDRHLSEAARRVVESIKRLLDAAVANNQIEIRTQPPTPSGTPPTVTPMPMPQLLQRIAQAREIYLARVDARQDREGVRESYDFNNALLLYAYGYWPQAKERFTRIFEERCSGPNADETGRVAWINLRNMAVAYNNPEEAERLSQLLLERRCTFAPDGAAGATPPSRVDCSRAENRDDPVCIAQSTLQAGQYRVAIATFNRAQSASGDEQARLYEQAATMFVRAVNNAPNDPQAPIALEQAAIALQRTNRFESAGRIYQRIIDEVAPRRGADAAEQARLDNIVSNAYFQLAYSASRNLDYDRAITNYRVLADSPRFAQSTDARIIERRENALINTANILEFQQRYAEAATYWRRVQDTSRDPNTQMTASYRVAEMSYKQRNWANTVRDMTAFIARYRTTNGAGELLVQAAWRIAEARRAQNNARELRAALQQVVDVFERSGQQPGSVAAEYAAQARFELIEPSVAQFETFAINPGNPATMQAYVQSLVSQIEAGANRAKTIAAGFDPVPAYRRPTWTIAAYVRQGRVYEVLARGVLNAPFVLPADMQAQMRRLSADQRDEIRAQVQDRVQQTLDAQVRPIECLAVQRYALAARAARVASIDNEYTRLAIDRLNAYGEEVVTTCVTQANANDSSFALPSPGEFTRAPRGQNLDIQADIAPPTFAPDDQ